MKNILTNFEKLFKIIQKHKQIIHLLENPKTQVNDYSLQFWKIFKKFFKILGKLVQKQKRIITVSEKPYKPSKRSFATILENILTYLYLYLYKKFLKIVVKSIQKQPQIIQILGNP